MKTRIISALVALIILFAVTFSNSIVFGITVFILAVIGLYEFYNIAGEKGLKPMRILGYLSALPILALMFAGESGAGLLTILSFRTEGISGIDIFSAEAIFRAEIILSLAYLFLLALFVVIIASNMKYNFLDASVTVLGALYVSFLFSFLVLARNMTDGNIYIWFAFIGSWGTDTFAFFAGKLFGRRKLVPDISPKKTVEGAIGGLAGCISLTLLFGLAVNHYSPGLALSISGLAVLGLVNGVVSQLGDLTASTIKRYAGVKDFGRIMPGHGGVIDRFDSIMFVMPVVYFYFSLFAAN